MRKGEALLEPCIRVELDTSRGQVLVACSEKQRKDVKRILQTVTGSHRLADVDEVIVLVAAAGMDRHCRKRLTVEVGRSVRAILRLEGLL